MSATPTKPNDKSKSNGLSAGIIILVIFVLLLVAVGIWGTCSDSGRDAFANIKSKLNFGGTNLRSLDVIMFMSPTCPYCIKMMGVLDTAGQLKNLTIVDVSKPEGAAMAQQFGADKQPVPSFISRKNKTGTIGARKTVAELIDALKPPAGQPTGQPMQMAPSSSEEPTMPGQIDINLVKALQIVMFARENCGWCQKAKEHLAQTGVADMIQIVDIMTPEGQSMAGKVLPPGSSSVPAWTSMVTKKSVIGFKPIDQIIQELQSGNVPNVMS